MATSATETRHAGEFLLSEAPGTLSREAVTVVSGQNLGAGAVLGKITASGKVTAYDNASILGPETAYGILLAPVDASSADAAGVAIVRLAEVKADALGWGTQDSTAQTAAGVELLAVYIRVRT